MKRRVLALLGAVTLLMTLAVVPAQADPPEQADVPFIVLFPDFEHDVAVFWNISRDDFCAWLADGAQGEPPAIEPVSASFHETGQGAVVGSYQATRPLELWVINDPANPVGPCEDTAGQDGPLAIGHAKVTSNDNDLDVSGTRTNAFGDRGRGTVVDGDGGQWHYSWNFTATIDQNGEFNVRTENHNFKKKGK